jgi:elongation factor G
VDAGKKTKLDQAEPGQIVLIAGLRHATTGDTLCAPGHLLGLERIQARAPVLGLAIEALAGTEEEKLLEVLDKVTQEDPTLAVEEDPETGQRLLRGMGELHLQMVLERMEREFGVRVRSGRPAVAVRETIRRAASADAFFTTPPSPDGKHPDLMARVALVIEPLARGAGIRVVVDPRVLPEGAVLTDEQRRAIESGLRSGLDSGPLQGAALLDLALAVREVELFGPGSTPEALAAAANKALRQALGAAQPALMQPVMALEVIVPEVNLGAVLGDLQSRAAMITDTGNRGETAEVRAQAPLAALLGYTTTLRSLTQGRGQFNMEFLRFDLCAMGNG